MGSPVAVGAAGVLVVLDVSLLVVLEVCERDDVVPVEHCVTMFVRSVVIVLVTVTVLSALSVS